MSERRAFNSTLRPGKGFKRKSYTWKRSSKPLGFSGRLKAGPKTKAWNAERRRLKADSERNGRTTCELRGVIPHECTYDDFLGYAHDAKRRKLSKADLSRAILICNNAHDIIEVWPADEMKRIVNDTIAARGKVA